MLRVGPWVMGHDVMSLYETMLLYRFKELVHLGGICGLVAWRFWSFQSRN